MPLTEYQQEYAHVGSTRVNADSIQPLEDQVVIRLDVEAGVEKVDLLYRPMGHTRKMVRFGTVLAVGPGDRKRIKLLYRHRPHLQEDQTNDIWALSNERWPMEVKVGDRVAFERRPWAQFEFNGEQCVVLHQEQHILGVYCQFCTRQGCKGHTHSAISCFHPIMDRYLVKLVEEKQRGAILLPGGGPLAETLTGEVIRRGTHSRSGMRMQPLSAEEGEKVLFNAMPYPEVELWGKDFLMLRESDLLAVLE